MPVVNLNLARLADWFPGKPVKQLIDALPFIALDIESITDHEIRIEYNPNRPDFSSDYGITRALKGYLGIEIGIPEFKLTRTNKYRIIVDISKNLSRPYITALVARNLKLDELDIKQLFAVQDDLHDGIGRQRIKASIGFHDLDSIKFPLKYTSVSNDYSFTYVHESSPITVEEFMNTYGVGYKYHQLQKNSGNYTVLLDKNNRVLSFPPVTNCESAKVEPGTNNLFVEVTSSDQKLAEDIIAILATTMNDMGFMIHTAVVETPGATRYLPNMKPSQIIVTRDQINGTLGTKLSTEEILMSLRKCRLDAKVIKKNGSTIICSIPRYRVDVFDKIDIVEEVAIGYGIENLIPTIPFSNISGNRSTVSRYLDIIRITLVGLGFLEVNNFGLVDKKMQFDLMGTECDIDRLLTVEGAQNAGLDNLRISLIPSLMQTLSHNIHETYPQNIFEIGKAFSDNEDLEQWHLAVLLANTKSNFTEAKSVLQSILSSSFAKDLKTEPEKLPFFINGRCAKVIVDLERVGELGEISSLARDNFKLRIPVSGFEINLSKLLHIKS